MPELKYDIIKTLGVLEPNSRGWAKELNLIKWNERDAKYDLREWSPAHDRMGKGLTLSLEEMKALKAILDAIPELKQ